MLHTIRAGLAHEALRGTASQAGVIGSNSNNKTKFAVLPITGVRGLVMLCKRPDRTVRPIVVM